MNKKLSYIIVLAIALVIVFVARTIAFSGKDKNDNTNQVTTSSQSVTDSGAASGAAE